MSVYEVCGIRNIHVDVIIPSEDINGEIEFKHFSFIYPSRKDKIVLNDINLHIKAGESVGIVGKIGSGKSSLANMLFRLYNVEENTLFIDGYDIMHLPVKLVRDTV